MAGFTVSSGDVAARLAAKPANWQSRYLGRAVFADASCGLIAGLLAYAVRFGSDRPSGSYLTLSLLLPGVWLLTVAMAGGYDSRFIGVGPDEFRRVVNAGVFLTASLAVISYAAKVDLARGYVLMALPTLTLADLLTRYALRKRLHRVRRDGQCLQKVVAVGDATLASELAGVLRRESYHGLAVVAACVTGPDADLALAQAIEPEVPLIPGLDDVVGVVERFQADTVAVLACPEMSGIRLRELAWALEKTDTDLCVAPALLDVAGPRTTIRPVAGLPLLHLDHPEFTGFRRLIKAGFDRAVAAVALVLLSPLLLVVAAAVRLGDGGPVLFRQERVGRDGRSFRVFKFRTMVVNAESMKAVLDVLNESDGLLFKMRRDPRITPVGAWLRRWSLDELPQLVNVVIGDMSLVGPRPALPQEAARYADHVRRRLVVKPGMTGLWQVNGRSDLSWEETVRLDLRYVDNWSFVLDLQILWKTCSAVWRGSGAY